MSLLRRRHFIQRAGGVLAAAMCALPEVSHAAPWPSRPVRLIVVYPPGGVSDGMARVLAEPLAQSLGVPVLIENRPGAGGSLGMDALARATPDGCTLAFSAISPLTLHPLLARVPYDPQRAFVPVASVMRTPVLVVGTPAFTGHGFGQLIAQARRQPGEVRWATSGVATIGHLVLAQVRVQSRTDITHIPYQGGGPQLNDALSGQFEVLSTNVAAQQLQYIEGGRFQALAVGAPARIEALPAVPTLAELGFEKANRDSLFGIFAPARTPVAVVQRLNAEINRVLDSSVVRARLRGAYNLPAGGGTDDFAHEIAVDRRRNRELVAGDRSQFD
ncbi:Tripartite-type tricarboxylate transporter, receptor component TctC [Variovorax sp. YR634]|jgi:tripartite-type tricarboxylate transporter receptor subunit TctC|uniref:Bug family tripartite tricarboxylate transporter substrate binding protein n=1 Tax=Variovorax TaxID=34072 RepID=UPI00089D2236|nr:MULTISPECIES: tripartite tricarboxylate transporter substrate binding protein [Variovorax]MDQ0079837.1 tripartite-type tricarboxylate transporter receptor subunit TctC [Variovorax boronicumulans]SDW32034.1 Tripartite-type tricarboxylate transporter, receptor component TctC [Variovorax sp. YR634]